MQSYGNLVSVAQFKVKDIKQYYDKYVSPNNLVIALVGDFDSEQVKSFVASQLQNFVATHNPKLPDIKEMKQTKIRHRIKTKDSNQAIVALGFHSVDLYNEDQYPLEIIASIYSGQGSRLFKTIREERGLAYTVGAYQVLGVDPGFFTFYAGTRPDKAQEVIDLILEEIRLLKQKGISEEELVRAQNGLIGRRQKSLESSSQFAFKIALDQLYGVGAENYKLYAERLRSVTREDVKRIANKYFNENAYALIEVKPELSE